MISHLNRKQTPLAFLSSVTNQNLRTALGITSCLVNVLDSVNFTDIKTELPNQKHTHLRYGEEVGP